MPWIKGCGATVPIRKHNLIFEEIPPLFVEVIIPLALPKNYTWAVPVHLEPAMQPGIRVEVGFGKNKRYAGIVKAILQDAPATFKPKDILNVLDNEPLLHPQQLAFWEWLADYYMCSEGEVMQAAIPSNLKLSSESILQWNEERSNDFSGAGEKIQNWVKRATT